MNYHNITKDDMLNGDGLRVVLWVSGCSHQCKGCHNPETWNPCSGIPFDVEAREEIFKELDKDYISGITLSGGDPLHMLNRPQVNWLIDEIRRKYTTKTIWLYTGYTEDEIKIDSTLSYITSKCDVVVTGRFVEELADPSYEWAGSTNQKIIRNGKK